MAQAKRQSKRQSKRRKGSKKCPKGQIRRKSYSKKSHLRRSYRRKNGSRVKASYVDKAKVSSTCVPDKGAPGKTPLSRQVLPKLGKDVSLRRFGYDTDKSVRGRHEALDKASARHNPLKVIRHLNLARNYQADAKAKRVMGEDVKYMSRQYTQYKKKHGMSRSRKASRKTSKKRRGSLRKASRKRRSLKKTSRKSKKRSRKASRKH